MNIIFFLIWILLIQGCVVWFCYNIGKMREKTRVLKYLSRITDEGIKEAEGFPNPEEFVKITDDKEKIVICTKMSQALGRTNLIKGMIDNLYKNQ